MKKDDNLYQIGKQRERNDQKTDRTQECRKTQQGYLFHTNAVFPHRTSQQAHAWRVTTLDFRHSCINKRPLPRYPRNLSVTLHKHDLCRLHATFVTLQ